LRGTPLTPVQVAKAVEVYTQTGNYSAAARAIEASVSATRDAILRVINADRRKLHARACERGLRNAGRAIRYGLAKAKERFDHAVDAKEFSEVMRATTDAAKTLGREQDSRWQQDGGGITNAGRRALV
jgi:hypothetical protein